MLGKELSSKAIEYIEDNYSTAVINITGASKNGWPDLIVCITGKFFGFEIKGKGDTEKEVQKQKLELICKEGGFAGFVYSLSDIDRIIKNKEVYTRNDKQIINL